MNESRALIVAGLIAGVVLCVSCGSGGNSSAGAANAQHAAVMAPVVETTKVTSRKLAITARLPGELQPYEAVSVYPKVTAFVDWIGVDRGSFVKTGQLMARLVAPEIA